jgi:uncharacterized Actinobacterial protein TIGR03083
VIDHLAELARHQDQFLATIEVADRRAPVASCGRWLVEDLVAHLAEVHLWAAARAQDLEPGGPPAVGDDLAAHYRRAAVELREVLGRLDPDQPTWTLLDDGPQAGSRRGTVRFWHRRQALETLVHLWDLRTAVGLDFEPGREAWLDCLDEVLTVMHPRQVRLGRVPAAGSSIEFIPDGAAAMPLAATSVRPGAVVRGTPRALALLVWGRTSLDDPDLRVEGDRDGLAAILAAGLTP